MPPCYVRPHVLPVARISPRGHVKHDERLRRSTDLAARDLTLQECERRTIDPESELLPGVRRFDALEGSG